MDDFQKALHFRSAIKEFDTQKKISKQDLDYILDSGRLAPSAFGLEPWKFYVISSLADKVNIEKLCFNQKQISTCSHLIIIVAKISDMHENSPYLIDMLKKRVPKEFYEKMLSTINNFTNNMSDEQLKFWCQKQCYISASHLMMASAYLGIDSCPMEGFNEKALLDYLKLDKEDFSIALVLPLGYRVEEPWEKKRLELSEIVEYIE